MLNPTLNKLKNLLPRFNSGLTSRFCIGLDLGLDRLNLVQMERLSGVLHIRAITSIAYPCSRDELLSHPKILKPLLAQAYATQPFKGKRVVSCLPIDQIKIITIAYKKTEGQQDAVAIVAELRERFKAELDGMVVDFMTLRPEETDSGKYEALVALASREKVVAYLDYLSNAGLEVEALDIGPAALARLVSNTCALHSTEYANQPNALLINFGADSSYLTIIWGRRLMLDRPVEFSENRIFSRLKQVLNMPEDLILHLLYESDASIDVKNGNMNEVGQMVSEVLKPELTLLLQEINKTLIYTASKTRGKSIDRIYLSGRLARYSGILDYLRGQLNVPVDILDPVEVFAAEKSKVDNHRLGTMAGIALTTGLALRGVSEYE